MGEIKLIPWQEEVEKAFKKGASHVYVKAGRKAGKTEYILHRMKEWAKEEPKVSDQINPYIAPYRTQAKNIFWRRVKSGFDKSLLTGRPRETDMALDLVNGIRIQLFGADHEESMRGLIFGPRVLDEADFMRSTFDPEIAEPNAAPTQGAVLMCSTPKNGWFTKKWKEAHDGLAPRGHEAFRFTIYDNPHISRRQIELLRRSVPTDVWDQEYLAKEGACSGLQYHEFQASHIIRHKEPKMVGKFARSADWGFDHPTACLWAEVFKNPDTGRWALYFYREFSMRGKCVAEVAKPIIAADNRPLLLSILDSASLRTEMGTGTSIASEFKRNGVSFRMALRNDAYNINCAKMMLQNNDVLISENCRGLIDQLRTVEWGQKKDDDFADAYKYLCGMTYGRDFENIESFFSDLPKANGQIMLEQKWPDGIDPAGILAAPGRQESMEWSPY